MRLSRIGDGQRAVAAGWSSAVGAERPRKRDRHRLRPAPMPLEDRRLLSTFDVTSTADDGSSGTLRWAIDQANAASSPSTIDFQFPGVTKTITLTQGPLELSNTTAAITIDGPGVDLLSINGNDTGGVFQVNPGVTASLSGLTIRGASASSGGGVDNAGALTLTDCTITGNTAQTDGAGLSNSSTATLTGCTIIDNYAGGLGGAMYNLEGGNVTLTGCTMTSNSAEAGGSLSNSGAATLTGCTISGNSAYVAGGLADDGTATLTGCTISGNSAKTDGGGLFNHGTATLSLTACTVEGNSAIQDGGGLYNNGTAALSLTACTVTGNSATDGGGIYTYSGAATLTDTIIAGNAATTGTPSDVGGKGDGAVIGSYNLVGTGGAGGLTAAEHNLLDAADPLLSLLGDYGGPTRTMALLPGSPAIGAGTAVIGVNTDQRGLPLDSPPDIGAYQIQAPGATTFDVTSTADDGSTGTLRWAVAQADAASSPCTIDFQLTGTPATIALTQGPLVLSNTAAAITIEGPGAALLSVNGNQSSHVFAVDEGVVATISGLTIAGAGSSSTSFGGGVYDYGTITLSDCTISGNSDGGATVHFGSAILLGCTISGNSGGGLSDDGTVTLSDCTISGNSGGGLSDTFSTAALTGCTISGNSAGRGGGVYVSSGTVTFTDCTISGNSSAAFGGGVDTYQSDLILDACTVSGNSGGTGGGLNIPYGSTATLTDCTISGNSASGTGGGLSSEYGRTTVTACTISGNTAADGGGLVVAQGSFSTTTLVDTIVAGNAGAAGASDIEDQTPGTPVTGSYNLIGTGGSGGLTNGTSGNVVLTSLDDLDLGPLADNGGPTQTMALLPGSPAIGAGAAASGLAADQRGLPLDSPPDIGAYQIQANPTQPIGLSFSGLASPSVAFGTASVTLSGALAAGALTPQGETVTITLDGVSQQAAIGAGGAFSATFDTSALGVSGSPYAVSYSYAGDSTYGAATDSSLLTVTPATPKVTVSDAGGTYNGRAFPAAATVAGIGGTASPSLEGATPTLTYYSGTSAAGPPLSGPPGQGGTYTVVASFAGTTDYKPAQSAATFTIQPATASLSLSLSTTSIEFGQSVTVVATVSGPGAAPGGIVTFYAYFNPNIPLGTAPVDAAGHATLTTAGFTTTGLYPIVAKYSGDADLSPTSATSAGISITPATVQTTVLPPQPVFKNKTHLVSVGLTVRIQSTVPGAGLPSGVAYFELGRKSHGRPRPSRPKILGQATVQGGTASVSLRANQVLNKTIAVFFSGSGYDSGPVTLPLLTLRTLKSLAR